MPSLTNFNGEALMALGDLTPSIPLTVSIHGRISNEQVGVTHAIALKLICGRCGRTSTRFTTQRASKSSSCVCVSAWGGNLY